MDPESLLHEEMLRLYRSAGDAVGYWGRRYKGAVERNGGLKTAKRMLEPRSTRQKGLEALLEANRPDLTLEYLVLESKFKSLFTEGELNEARRRLAGFVDQASQRGATRPRLYPDELEPGQSYPEGARKTVRVNAFERNTTARKKCIAHHGPNCAACGMSFPQRYGGLGDGFIHVHHRRPLADVTTASRVDPVADLVPVCPNCHAMLHFGGEQMLEVEELRAHLVEVDKR